MTRHRRVADARVAARVALLAATAAAALVLAGCSSGAPSDVTLPITGTDDLQFRPSELSAAPGTITVELTAEQGDEHTFVIEELNNTEVVAAAAGETATGTIELEAGTYTFYCSVEGHRSAGMEGTLTVTE